MNKKQLALIALVIVLIPSNIAFAVLYMTKDVPVTFGISVTGSMEVYEDDGVTVLTQIDFDNFTTRDSQTRHTDFFINNTGDTPLYVYWDILTSSIEWTLSTDHYKHLHKTDQIYSCYIVNASGGPAGLWIPETEARIVDVGEGISEMFVIVYSGDYTPNEMVSLTLRFYAQDA